jgi:cation:H+ antiporter
VVFVVAALLTLVAGVVLERSGDAIASQIGLTGVLWVVGLVVVATSG